MFIQKEIIFSVFIIVGIWEGFKGENALKIVNGDEVEPHSLPYVVALNSLINGKNVRCAGSLISTTKVLTAASCLYGIENNVTIILGAHNLTANETKQKILVSSDFKIHEDYEPDTRLNDIAIIRLPEDVSPSDSIATILTPALADILKTYADVIGNVAGWGKSNDTDLNYSDVLRKVEVTIIPYLSCTIPYLFKVKQSQICTTGMQNGKNICTGDSGAPLVIEDKDGRKVQVGIASYGSDFGCSVGAPAVYTRLTSFYFWLMAN